MYISGMENARNYIRLAKLGCKCYDLSESALLKLKNQWMEEQKSNIVLVCIEQPGLPSIKMLAEAGLIGKIGLNSSGTVFLSCFSRQ